MVTFQVLRGAGAMGWTGECDPTTCWTTAVGCVGFYSLVLLGSRFVFSPAIAPVTYQRLGKQPGQQGYWDSSFASTVNGVINTILVVWVVARDPRLLTLSDAFVSTDDSCKMVVLFMTWCIFDLAQVLYYYKHWEGMAATLVHHISAIVAWMLYLEGGYGHSLSLLGVFCEVRHLSSPSPSHHRPRQRRHVACVPATWATFQGAAPPRRGASTTRQFGEMARDLVAPPLRCQ